MPSQTFRILMIDDDADDILIFGDILKENFPHANFSSQQTGEQALEFLQTATELPDLIVLDINMYSIDGFEIALRLRNDERLKNIPIVGYTTSMETADKALLIRNGANECFVKPYKVTEIITVQQQMISTAAQLDYVARA